MIVEEEGERQMGHSTSHTAEMRGEMTKQGYTPGYRNTGY